MIFLAVIGCISVNVDMKPPEAYFYKTAECYRCNHAEWDVKVVKYGRFCNVVTPTHCVTIPCGICIEYPLGLHQRSEWGPHGLAHAKIGHSLLF